MPESTDSDVRRKVMAAALALFCEQTWEGTRVPEIAERAGVSVGTIYRYFPSKEALGSAVFADAKAALTARTLTDEVRRAEPREALRGIWEGCCASRPSSPTPSRSWSTSSTRAS
ncbi:hypothetical protein BJF78_17365 [Pseudonocardia sp. CNS-139]|nr:hypothetical protein BJF78_17365 [Pseudonocardia sp. CNS-139]